MLRFAKPVGPIALLALSLALTACAGDDGPPPPCPQTGAVGDAARLVKFQGGGRDLTDVLFETRLGDLQLICEYDEGVIEANLKVSFFTERGPANAERRAQFRYFVAIVTADGRIVAREEFALSIPFEGNRTRVATSDELEPRIPLRSGESGADYRILVGYSLSPDELDYNRRNR